MQTTRRIGVILAAGRGRRMGGTKQLSNVATPEGPKPLVAAAFDAVRPICDEMIVVLGHEAEAVAAVLSERPFHRVLSDPDAQMFESIRAGLRAAIAIDEAATIVLQPGDQPQVARPTLDALIDASHHHPTKAIIPQFGTHGGRPVLIQPNIAEHLMEGDCPSGLGDFWLAHAELCVRVPVDDPTTLQDVDTLGDLL